MDDQPVFDFYLLIPYFNNIGGLQKAISSVEYHEDRCLLLVVDDGSPEPLTVPLLQSMTPRRYAVHLIRLTRNSGITEALNAGLSWIRLQSGTRYVARLDCGDSCTNDRFYKQVRFLDEHPGIGLLGSWCIFQTRNGRARYPYRSPEDTRAIIRDMHFRNSFIHPTVMFRSGLLETVKRYPSEYPYAEDYAFFWELMRVASTWIIPEYLVTCEINEGGISLKNRRTQLKSRRRVVEEYGVYPFLKIAGNLRIRILSLVPKRLALLMKRRQSNKLN